MYFFQETYSFDAIARLIFEGAVGVAVFTGLRVLFFAKLRLCNIVANYTEPGYLYYYVVLLPQVIPSVCYRCSCKMFVFYVFVTVKRQLPEPIRTEVVWIIEQLG